MDKAPMIFIIADDLTGACDTGACFAQRGMSTAVQISHAAEGEPLLNTPDVLVFNTESRSLPELQAMSAVQRISAAVQAGSAQDESWVYKKIDSTLRGHPGAELHALMDALQIDRALVTPAFPAQGRTVMNGQLLVQGHPLSQTVFACDGDLRATFAHVHLPLHTLTLDALRRESHSTEYMMRAPGITVADAQTDTDLRALAQRARESGIRLLCGSAGLAAALAEIIAPTHATPAALPPAVDPVLAVAGSLNPATVRQVRYARQHGIAVIQPPPGWMDAADADAPAGLVDALVTHLAQAGRAIVATCDLPESTLGRGTIAQALGALVAQVISRVALGGLVLTGGDVATAICTSLGARWLSLCGEAQPGIAIGRLADGPYAGVGIITKAGGFGGEDALLRSMNRLLPPVAT